MTYDELEAKLTKVVSEPDSAVMNILPVLEEIKKDYGGMTALSEELEKHKTKIRELQDTNMRLHLTVLGKTVETGTEEEINNEAKEVAEFFKGLN